MEQAQRSLQLADDFCSGMLPQIYPWYIEDYRRLSSQSLTGNIRVVKGFSNRPRIGFWHCSVLSWCHPILSLLKSWCLLDLNHIFSSVKLMKLVKCTSFEYLHHWKNPCLSSLNYITYSPHFWYWSCQVSCWGTHIQGSPGHNKLWQVRTLTLDQPAAKPSQATAAWRAVLLSSFWGEMTGIFVALAHL